MKEPIDGDCLILSGMEFQTVGAAKLKALRPMVVVVKGTCSRLCEEERRSYKVTLLTRYAYIIVTRYKFQGIFYKNVHSDLMSSKILKTGDI